MKRQRIWMFWLIGVLAGFCVPCVSAAPEGKAAMVLQKCVSNETGIAFACLPQWKLVQKGKSLRVVISESPNVDVLIEGTDQKVRFISELSRDALNSLGRYAGGFSIERFRYCDRETVKVNGYLKSDPQKRISDFYLIENSLIHSIKFTADSQEAWEEYKFVIKQIVESVTFLQHKENPLFLAEEKDGTCEELIATNGH